MKIFQILLVLLAIALMPACSQKKADSKAENREVTQEDKDLLEQARSLFSPLPDLADNADNVLTQEKIALGKKLYYDKRLSKDENVSCNSCHDLEKYGVDNLPTSPGDEGETGDRNSPTVLNAALHFVQFWDGRAKDVEEQAGGPILNPVEMGIPSEEFLVERLSGIEEYQQLYADAFPGEEDPLTYANTQKAIGAFERILLTPSAFDRYLEGDVFALDEVQRKGLFEFMDHGCTTCHMGVLLGGNMFHKFGVYDEYWKYTKSENIDEGLAAISGEPGQKFMFKVPSLRNVEKTFPYYHDGSVMELGEAVRIMGKTQLDQEMSDEEVANIQAFLKSLTGNVPEEALQGGA